ncbi:hypothetical protein PVK06_041159 [Gossypium arboreum]|uniref:Uncharacterized protein n=1 Tax=Gossypium arboreum TaxID=29729 RepID=A0ABR0N9P9_GOSAR|nr:hypothetical protein PVK06_041159 [Gossypium arboreum]
MIQTLDADSLQHIRYKKDSRSKKWIKAAQAKPRDDKDNDVEVGDPVAPSVPAPPQDTQFSVETSAILSAIESL